MPALDALLSSRHEVAAVITRPDAPAGRGRALTPSPIALRALEAGVELLRPVRASDSALRERLAEIAPDCCPVVAYGALIPVPVLALPPLGWVNLHFSLLPAWRGAAPVQHAILAGDEVTGASTFVLEEGLDTGPVLGVLTTQVGAAETAGALLERLAVEGAGLLVATLDGLADGELVAVPQPADGVSHAPKLTPADAEVDWAAPAQRVERLIRACTPAPGAWTTFRGERLRLAPVRPNPEPVPLEAGALMISADAVHVGTATTPVQLGEVQPAGKRMMAAADWARGVRIGSDERLG